MQFITPLTSIFFASLWAIQLGAWFLIRDESHFQQSDYSVAITCPRVSAGYRNTMSLKHSEINQGKDELRRVVKSSFYQFWLETFSVASLSLCEADEGDLEIHGLEYPAAGNRYC